MAIKDLNFMEKHLFICNGGTCLKHGAEETTRNLREYIADEGMEAQVHTTKTYCNGRCNDGPVVVAMPGNVWFKGISPDYCRKFVRQYVVNGEVPLEKVLFDYEQKTIR